MGGLIKICGQHVNTSCRRQHTVNRRGVRRQRKALWESVLSVHWRGGAQECVLHAAFLLESPGQRLQEAGGNLQAVPIPETPVHLPQNPGALRASSGCGSARPRRSSCLWRLYPLAHEDRHV